MRELAVEGLVLRPHRALLPRPVLGARIGAVGKRAALLAPVLGAGRGALRCRRFAGLGELGEQRLHHIGVELQSRGSTQFLASRSVSQPRAVGALAAHCLISVARRDHARAEWALLSREAAAEAATD